MSMKKIPQRMCVGCGEMKDKRELIRIVKTKENEISLDKTGKKAGRGAYICDNPECLKKARKNKRIEHSFKAPIPEEIYDRLAQEMENER